MTARALLDRSTALTFSWTNRLSHVSTPVICTAWATYTSLFKHLESNSEFLSRKTEHWKVLLAPAVTAAHCMLSKHYSWTDGQGDDIINPACVLTLCKSLTYTEVMHLSQSNLTHTRKIADCFRKIITTTSKVAECTAVSSIESDN